MICMICPGTQEHVQEGSARTNMGESYMEAEHGGLNMGGLSSYLPWEQADMQTMGVHGGWWNMRHAGGGMQAPVGRWCVDYSARRRRCHAACDPAIIRCALVAMQLVILSALQGKGDHCRGLRSFLGLIHECISYTPPCISLQGLALSPGAYP